MGPSPLTKPGGSSSSAACGGLRAEVGLFARGSDHARFPARHRRDRAGGCRGAINAACRGIIAEARHGLRDEMAGQSARSRVFGSGRSRGMEGGVAAGDWPHRGLPTPQEQARGIRRIHPERQAAPAIRRRRNPGRSRGEGRLGPARAGGAGPARLRIPREGGHRLGQLPIEAMEEQVEDVVELNFRRLAGVDAIAAGFRRDEHGACRRGEETRRQASCLGSHHARVIPICGASSPERRRGGGSGHSGNHANLTLDPPERNGGPGRSADRKSGSPDARTAGRGGAQ
jgi:hypothetical protein